MAKPHRQPTQAGSGGTEKRESAGYLAVGQLVECAGVETDLAIRTELQSEIGEALDGARSLKGVHLPEILLNLPDQEVAHQQPRVLAHLGANRVDRRIIFGGKLL